MALRRLLALGRRPPVDVITICGPPESGKSRLAETIPKTDRVDVTTVEEMLEAMCNADKTQVVVFDGVSAHEYEHAYNQAVLYNGMYKVRGGGPHAVVLCTQGETAYGECIRLPG